MAMAIVPASFSVFLCVLLLLFTSSCARSPLIDDTNHFLFPESDGNNPSGPHTILLPSDKHDYEDSDSESESDPIPFTLVTIRPLQPHFPRRPYPLSSRLHHRCRHNRHFKPFNPHLPSRHIPFTDHHDLTLHHADDTTFDPLPRGAARQIPARWTRFRRVEPSFSHEPGMDKSEEMTKPQDNPEPQHEETGLMKNIRKFLNRF